MDPNNSLRDIDRTAYRALVELYHNYNHDFVCGIKTAYFSPAVNPEVATNATAMDTVDCMKVLKIYYCMVMLYGYQRRRSVKI